MILQIDAEQIASALDKGHRIAPNRYMACCPAHDDKNPSFAITQTSERVLLYCFSGCGQREVIDALRQRNLWPDEKPPTRRRADRDELLTFCLAHEAMLKRDIPTSTAHKRLYRQYCRILCSPFEPEEIAEMDLYCRLYGADVRAGKTPTPEESETFMLYMRSVTSAGFVPYEW